MFFKLGVLLAGEYDVLVLEDLNVESLIQKGETRKRRMRLHDSAFSELRGCLEWGFVKRGKSCSLYPLTTRPVNAFSVEESTRV